MLEYFVADAYMDDIAYIICQIYQYLIQNKMIIIDDIHVSNTGSILQLIYIHWCRGNIQHSMLANPDHNNSLIDNYKVELFQIFMLELHVYCTW